MSISQLKLRETAIGVIKAANAVGRPCGSNDVDTAIDALAACVNPCRCGHEKGDHQQRIGQRGNYTPCCISGCACDAFRKWDGQDFTNQLLHALKQATAYASLNTVDPRPPTKEQLSAWRAIIAKAEAL